MQVRNTWLIALLLIQACTAGTAEPLVTVTTSTTISEETNLTSEVENVLPSDDLNFNFKVGDKGPMGGYIFYVADSYQPWGRFLEAFPDSGDWRDLDDYLEWGCYGDVELKPGGLGIGDGKANTHEARRRGCDNDVRGAPTVFGIIPENSDWYLPSLEEMNLLFEIQDVVCSGCIHFSDNPYWTSSNVDVTTAWETNGETMEKQNKQETNDYWLIRAF